MTKKETERTVPYSIYTEEYYLNIAGNKDEYLRGLMGERQSKAFALAEIKKGHKVLDIGCGRGEILYHSALRGAKGLGLDYSPDALKLSAKLISKLNKDQQDNLKFICADFESLKLKDNLYDVIFLLDVVEHLYQHQLVKLLEKVSKALKEDGKLIIYTRPNKLFWEIAIKYYISKIDYLIKVLLDKDYRMRYPENDKDMHVNEKTFKELKRDLVNANFRLKMWLENPIINKNKIKELNLKGKIITIIKYLYPFGNIFPLNNYFCMDLWAIASKMR